MAAEVFEEALTLRIGILEALASTGDSYPFPALQATGSIEAREFLAVVLENPYLRVTILPTLGGRILRIFDKRTSQELLPVRDVLTTEPGSPRGLRLPDGIQLVLSESDRLNSLGPVAHQLEEPMEEEDEAAVWLAESSVSPRVSWHLRVALPPDRAEIRFEARVLNRTLESVSYNGGLLGVPSAFGVASAELLPGFQRFDGPRELGPRQVDTWSVTLAPYALQSPQAASLECAVEIGESLRIQTSRPKPQSRVLLLTGEDQTMEATVDLYPENLLEMPLGGVLPKAVVIQSAKGEELLRFPAETTLDPYREMAFSAGRRHVAHLLRGIEAFKQRSFADADEQFETALLYNGDDPLLWWIKAVTQRLLGNSDERAELQNAHYLALLEPALRAEAFLTQSAEQGRAANPLLRPLLPDDLVEVACLLIEHGLLDQASRWIDEALRHADLAMLRYLMADILFQGTRMETEAAQHVLLGGRAQVPPYPWRDSEVAALRRLHERFPNDSRIADLVTAIP